MYCGYRRSAQGSVSILWTILKRAKIVFTFIETLAILSWHYLKRKWFYPGDLFSPSCVWALFEYPVSWCVLPPLRATSYRRKMMGLHCPWAPNNALWRHLPKAILSRPIPALDRQTESVGQTVLRHSPYGKAGPPLTDTTGCQLICHVLSRSFWMCSLYNRKDVEVMTAHRSWTTCQAKGKWRTPSVIDATQLAHDSSTPTPAAKKWWDCFSSCLLTLNLGHPQYSNSLKKTKTAELRQQLLPCVWRPPTCCKAAKRCWRFLQSWHCGREAFSWPRNVSQAPSICWEPGTVTEDGAARFKTLVRFNIRDHCNN